MNGLIFQVHRAHEAAGEVLELFELLVADVVEFEELVCLGDDVACDGLGFCDATVFFCVVR